MEIYNVQVFGSKEFGGRGNSPCVILYEDDIIIDQNQLLRLNKRNCSIICLLDIRTFKIRYFSNTKEIDLCIHGSLATIFCYTKSINKRSSLLIYPNNGMELKGQLNSENQVTIAIKGIQIFENLNFSNDIPLFLKNTPFQNIDVISIGSKKLFIEIKDYHILNRLDIDHCALKQWSLENKVNGIYIYTVKTIYKKLDYQCRAFNPSSGIIEDQATGIAAGALCWLDFLKSNVKSKDYLVGQGSDNVLNAISVSLDRISGLTKIKSKITCIKPEMN